MSQPAVKQDEQVPANDAEYQQTPDSKGAHLKAENSALDVSGTFNPVKQAIDEFISLVDEMDDIREILLAHGVPLRTTRLIVELGVQDKPDKQALAIDSAMEQVVQSMGQGCLERQVLENHIGAIVTLELELNHARSTAREAGLDPQALSKLAQMIQQNPGDGGVKAVNTLFGYAVACGIKTDQLAQVAAEVTQRRASVLPQIARKADSTGGSTTKRVVSDALIGFLIGVIVIYVLV